MQCVGRRALRRISCRNEGYFGDEYGIWAFVQNRLWLIARQGDLFDVDASANVDLRTIRQISLAGTAGGAFPSGGDDGRIRCLNDSGTITFQVAFTDGSRGIFTTSLVPEPSPLILFGIAIGLLTVLVKFRYKPLPRYAATR